MGSHLVVTATMVGLLLTGCVKRIPAYDEARRPISQAEIKRYKTNKYFTLYLLGGTAVSFGAGFFLGTVIDRSLDEEKNNAALWGTTAAGTVLGAVVFGIQGRNRDYNEAVEKVRERRKQKAAEELTRLKQKRQQIEAEKRRQEALRRQLEAEKKALEQKAKKKKNN